jgi:hypothetical protein
MTKHDNQHARRGSISKDRELQSQAANVAGGTAERRQSTSVIESNYETGVQNFALSGRGFTQFLPIEKILGNFELCA